MVEQSRPITKFFQPVLIIATYLFLYLPILVIALFSFNESRVSAQWTGFSLRWYAKLFHSPEILDALFVSLVVALFSMILSLILGTGFVVASRVRKSLLSYVLFYPNIVLPDIALAIGVLSMFAWMRIPLGYGSLIAGHTLIGLGFVIPIIRARFVELDPFLTEASADLGATTWQTFYKVLGPLLRPSLVACALIVFTLSLDDFLIAFFCASPKVQTLSIYIYSQLRETVDPSINAISVLLLALSSIAALILCGLKVVDQVIHHER
ncbi:ABC transporter permease [Candidatus Babeliales bacterium]|nr:ABC transporter permease [Candidatus Babeliales bacterium]